MTNDRFLKTSRQLLWPHGLSEKIGRAGAVLSMVGWARAGFHFELGPILLAALEKYEKLVNFLLGWADPYISVALTKIAEWFDWHLHLHPHWRHVFVLIGLYCFRGARADYKEGNRITGTFRLVMGFAIALCTSVGLGVMPLIQTNKLVTFLTVAIPVFALFVNDASVRAWRAMFTLEYESKRLQKNIDNRWEYFSKVFFSLVKRTLAGFIIAFFGSQISFIQSLPSSGLIILAAVVVALGFQQLYLGSKEASSLQRSPENWLDAFLRSRGTMIGLGILGAFCWFGLLLFTEAGLAPFGLG